ncbi:MAG: Asp-tRNA(Asn)/Glu-tRNA(Gln) amidotransferase subunit GatC [Planctomycetes bacterium]|nr:Asp-tRNA(Asn)/Glu-tRNA(Gln) amidotransferase subunit GatC [Planctomycetota bacterium]
MQKISAEEVKKIAMLSRLRLSDAEVAKFAGQLESILAYIDTLSEVDVSAVEPFSAPRMSEEGLRPDALGPTLPRAAALANAPQEDGCFFQVPTIVK